MNRLALNFLPKISFKNPILSASGCFGNSLNYKEYFDPNILGGTILKGLTLEPKDGNYGQRIAETPSGMLNSIGLENPGIKKFVKQILPEIEKNITIPIIANINGNTIKEYIGLAEEIEKLDKVSAIELNVSCPNVSKGGMSFGVDAKMVYKVCSLVKKVISKPLIVKLTPNVSDIRPIIRALEESGANAISLINTVLGMAVDIENEKPILGNIFGGLSGPAIKPIGLRYVYQARQVTNLPIIGLGGIANSRDVIEYMMVGANAVSIGTAMLINPMIIKTIVSDLENYCKRKNLKNLQEIVGVCHEK